MLNKFKDSVVDIINGTKKYNTVNVDDVEIENKGKDQPIIAKAAVQTPKGVEQLAYVNQAKKISVKNNKGNEGGGNEDANAKGGNNAKGNKSKSGKSPFLKMTPDQAANAAKKNPEEALAQVAAAVTQLSQ